MKTPLAVTINLNSDQRDTLTLACKGKPFNPFSRNNSVEVTAETVLHVREAVVELFRLKFNQKTKTAQVLSICYDCERIIDKIDNILDTFGIEAPEEPVNDNDFGIVSITVPSLTKVEESVDAEATGEVEGFEKLVDTLKNKPAKSKGKTNE